VPGDYPAILRLNFEFERYLSPLDEGRLRKLHAQAAIHRVAVDENGIAGFLLGFREGEPYDSPNYRWFTGRYPCFLYIDRVVVAARAQGAGIGSLLYEDAIEFARRDGAGILACEFDIEPPNPGSEKFHLRLGFTEVGRQAVAGGRKTVSLQMLAL